MLHDPGRLLHYRARIDIDIVREDLERLTLWQLRERFMAEHDIANSAIDHGDLPALDAALSRERLYMDELRRRIVLRRMSAGAAR